MAITPWCWTTSNGTASAAQTKAAYAALTSSGNTAAFHRYVWNDLVSKVNEVVTALNLSWADTYGSLLSMPIYFPYENLTAARFNALRYNTRYNSWSWEYDALNPWYTGRTDFRGVGSVGESAADIVYGRYFLELTERLNVVIGIINGTTPTEDLDLSLISSLLPEVDLFSGASAALGATKSGIIIPSAALQSENLPSLTLHILVPSPTLSAALETDEISSRLAGYIFMTCSVGERRLIRLPPVPLAAVIPVGMSAQSFIDTLPSLGFTAEAMGSAEILGKINIAESRILVGSAHSEHTVIGESVSLPIKNPGWCHTRVNLDIHNTLVAEMVREFVSITAAKLTATPELMTRLPRVFSSGIELFSNAYPNIETAPPTGIITENIINSPTVLATVGTAHFIKDFVVSEALKSPTFVAKVELDHISTLLGAYLNMLTSGEGVLEKVEPIYLVQATDIIVPITSVMVDKLFTRAGAGDDMARRESTFMVEMLESAAILNNVTDKSLVLFDEIGRGTSTYDGISIAWAIVEYLHEKPGARAKTLFATHYHELNQMAEQYSRIKNFHIAVKERGQKVLFLHKMITGGIQHSFGIHVAGMAGMPRRVILTAQDVLKDLEQEKERPPSIERPKQLSFFQLEDPLLQALKRDIESIDLNGITPLEAFDALRELKRKIGQKE